MIRPHAGTASFVIVSTPRCASVMNPFLRVLPAFALQNRLTVKNAWRIEASGDSFLNAEEGDKITKDH